jgi:hypothetical protein
MKSKVWVMDVEGTVKTRRGEKREADQRVERSKMRNEKGKRILSLF